MSWYEASASRDTTPDDWNMERVSFDAAYGKERMAALVFLPEHPAGPLQSIVYFPGSGAISIPSSIERRDQLPSFVVKTGRAFVLPILTSTYERHDSLTSDVPDNSIFWRDLLAYLVMPGDHTAVAEAVFAKDPTWVAPIHWRSELRSVVHKYIMRGDLTVAWAMVLLGQAGEVLNGREGDVDSRDVLDLASNSNCTTYDCEYVALANTLGVPLITTDRAVLKAFPKRAMTSATFLDE